MQIDHINIRAPMDLLQKARDFYCDVLGLTEGFRPNISGHGFWIYAGDKPIIHLSESADRARTGKPGFFDHFALRASEPATIIEKLDKAGIEYVVKSVDEINLTQVFCKDPAGIGVELNFLDQPG